MNREGTEATVSELPTCDFDPAHGEAHYDGRVKGHTAWAYMCEACFETHGVGLGLGVGQRLVVATEPTEEKPLPSSVGALVNSMRDRKAGR